MKLFCESPHLQDYLIELKEVDFRHPSIQGILQEQFNEHISESEITQKA